MASVFGGCLAWVLLPKPYVSIPVLNHKIQTRNPKAEEAVL